MNDVSLLTDVLLRDCVVLSSRTVVCSMEDRNSPCCCCGWSKHSRHFLFLFLLCCSGIAVSSELVDISDRDDIAVTHSNGGCAVVKSVDCTMTQSETGSDVAWSEESTVMFKCGPDVA